mgnify:CR=1 FL=1
MDIGALKIFLPIAILAITGLIAIVKVKSRADQSYQDLKGIQKDLDRLEKQSNDWSRTTVKLAAQQEQAEKNITKLWAANESSMSREDKARDRLDERFIALRDRFNGDKK